MVDTFHPQTILAFALNEKPLEGPLIVEEYDTTIVVPPDGTVRAMSGIVRIRLKDMG